MRILFISRRYFPAISGMSVYAQNLLGELVTRGHDVVMISQYRDDEIGRGVYGGGPPPAVAGVEVIGLESVGEAESNHGRAADFERDITAMVDTALACHADQPFDLVHAQYGYPCGLAALEISRQTGLPNLVSIQGGDGHWVGTCCATHKQAMQAVLEHANELLIGSASFADEVGDNHGTPRERFTIVPGAVDTTRFYPSAERALGAVEPDVNNPGANNNEPVFVYHGRVDRRKGVLELIEAVDRLRDGPAFRVLISGIGPDYEAAREAVAERDLGAIVSFSGYVDYAEVPAVYRSGHIFVSPTWSEGFSNTILEAMASGLPVISTDSVGVVDCLRDDHNGLLVAVHDVAGLAEAMQRLITDDGLRRRLAETALADVGALYRWPVVADQIEARYQAVLDTAPDNRWTTHYSPETTRETASANCRFRAQPHLL